MMSRSKANEYFPLSTNWKILVGLALMLLAAAVFQRLPKKQFCYFRPTKPLIDYLPPSTNGWIAEKLPLGETELVSAKTQEVLRLSDYAHLRYVKNNTALSVYCAYWRPGVQSVAEAGLHNPDVCWVEAGWRLMGKQAEIKLSAKGQDTLPGQYRCFRSASTSQYVVFWHVSAGRLTGYAMGVTENWTKRLPYIWRNFAENFSGMSISEQVMVRISSNVPIESLLDEPFFREIVWCVSRFGLMQESQ